MFIDIETGTVLNGPIYYLPNHINLDDLSDQGVIELALAKGTLCQIFPKDLP